MLQPQEKKADSVKTNADVLLRSYIGLPKDIFICVRFKRVTLIRHKCEGCTTRVIFTESAISTSSCSTWLLPHFSYKEH